MKLKDFSPGKDYHFKMRFYAKCIDKENCLYQFYYENGDWLFNDSVFKQTELRTAINKNYSKKIPAISRFSISANKVFSQCMSYLKTNVINNDVILSFINDVFKDVKVKDSDKLLLRDNLIERLRQSIKKQLKQLIKNSYVVDFETFKNDAINVYSSEIVTEATIKDLQTYFELDKTCKKQFESYSQKFPEATKLFKINQASFDDSVNNFLDKRLICPSCEEYFQCSSYLAEVFADNPKVEWLANMVTHYRHDHLTSWNKCWGRYGSYYRGYWFKDYDEEKAKVNERQKRQILRQCKDFLIENNFTVKDFECLQNTTEETILLAKKILRK